MKEHKMRIDNLWKDTICDFEFVLFEIYGDTWFVEKRKWLKFIAITFFNFRIYIPYTKKVKR